MQIGTEARNKIEDKILTLELAYMNILEEYKQTIEFSNKCLQRENNAYNRMQTAISSADNNIAAIES